MNTRFCGTHPSCLQARVVYLFSDLSFHSSADTLVHRLVREPRLDTDTDHSLIHRLDTFVSSKPTTMPLLWTPCPPHLLDTLHRVRPKLSSGLSENRLIRNASFLQYLNLISPNPSSSERYEIVLKSSYPSTFSHSQICAFRCSRFAF